MLPPVLGSAVAVIALVACDQRDYRPGRYLFKPLAALAFIWLAVVLGAPDSELRPLATGGLAVHGGRSVTDAGQGALFPGGLIAFLCGHLLYATAFYTCARTARACGFGATRAGPAGVCRPLADAAVLAGMKLPVAIYTPGDNGDVVAPASAQANRRQR